MKMSQNLFVVLLFWAGNRCEADFLIRGPHMLCEPRKPTQGLILFVVRDKLVHIPNRLERKGRSEIFVLSFLELSLVFCVV
jgi:hypothetical protein